MDVDQHYLRIKPPINLNPSPRNKRPFRPALPIIFAVINHSLPRSLYLFAALRLFFVLNLTPAIFLATVNVPNNRMAAPYNAG